MRIFWSDFDAQKSLSPYNLKIAEYKTMYPILGTHKFSFFATYISMIFKLQKGWEYFGRISTQKNSDFSVLLLLKL